MLDRYYRRREAAIVQLGGKCVVCGSDKDLEIDHIDPKDKEISFGKAISGWSEERIQKELAKAQLLCKEHHTLKSIADRGHKVAKGTHGTISSYRYCKCAECKAANAAAVRRHRAKKRLDEDVT